MLLLSNARTATRGFSLSRSLARRLYSDYESKYKNKLEQRAKEQGTSLAELRQRIKEQEKARLKQRSIEIGKQTLPAAVRSAEATLETKSTSTGVSPTRKDSSPIKPLSSYLNLGRILQTPHSADQISSLWTAYHASRSNGTGRGFICATIPIDIYTKMSSCGSKYPTFAVPLPRDAVQDDSGESKKAYEFYFLQWAFHMAPPIPSQTSDFEPLSRLINEGSTENPSISTILFTPLQEYKLRTTFAVPYLVLTNYTDFVKTHGIVLLRGEITPSAAAENMVTSGSDFLLSQQDAQLLAMQLQNFYLWIGEGSGNKEREHLLETFHENPQEFKWENLLKYAHPV